MKTEQENEHLTFSVAQLALLMVDVLCIVTFTRRVEML